MMLAGSSGGALSQYPIVEMTVAALVALITILAMISANRKRNALPAADQLPDASKMFFDGPLVQALKSLQNIEKYLADEAEERRVKAMVTDKLDVAEDQRERGRWDDVFKIARECRDRLDSIASKLPRR